MSRVECALTSCFSSPVAIAISSSTRAGTLIDPRIPGLAAYPAGMPDAIALTGHGLTLEAVESVARDGAVATLAPDARARMHRSRAVIEAIVAGGEAVYGVTTGFGDLATQRIEPADAARLQENL